MRALRLGDRPDGSNYFPAFPYPSFTKITDSDARDLWAYLRTLPASAKPSREHDLWFFFGWRWTVTFWKWFFFTPGAFANIPGVSEVVNRGAYLVQALAHCGECHTPRNFLGGPKSSRFLAGGKGPDGKAVANLTPTELKKQSDKDLKDLLTTGMTPDGDVLAEAMGEVVTNTISKLTPADLDALIAYLRTLPAASDREKELSLSLPAKARASHALAPDAVEGPGENHRRPDHDDELEPLARRAAPRPRRSAAAAGNRSAPRPSRRRCGTRASCSSARRGPPRRARGPSGRSRSAGHTHCGKAGTSAERQLITAI